MEIVSIIVAAGFVLFLPGFAISFVFFVKGKIDVIERIALSFALSIAVVPLVTFYTNLLGVPITKISVVIQIFSLLALTGVTLAVKHLIRKGKTYIDLPSQEYKPEIHNIQATPPNRFIANVHIILDELFKVSLVTYLLLLILETIKEGFVTYFFDPTVLLYIVIASGIGMAITQHIGQEIRKESGTNKVNWFYIYCMSFLGAALVYIKTDELGNLSLIITVATFISIVLVSYLIFTERE